MDFFLRGIVVFCLQTIYFGIHHIAGGMTQLLDGLMGNFIILGMAGYFAAIVSARNWSYASPHAR